MGATGPQGPAGPQGPSGGGAPDYDSGWMIVDFMSSPLNPPTFLPVNYNGGFTPSRVQLQECGYMDSTQTICQTPIVINDGMGYHDGTTNINPIMTVFVPGGNNALIELNPNWWAHGWIHAGQWNCYPNSCFRAWYRLLLWR
jgi:hypothetical protein